MKNHVALYGNLKINRSYCYKCKRWSLVDKQNKRFCCGSEMTENPEEFKVMCSALNKRKRPSKEIQDKLLEEYNFKCCYCDNRFDEYINYGGKIKKIRLNWDHMTPYSYSYNNNSDNFLPSCNFCNTWKYNLMFQTIEEVRIYVKNKWEEKNGKNPM